MSKVLYNWFDAATCVLYGHKYRNGKCATCGKKQP